MSKLCSRYLRFALALATRRWAWAWALTQQPHPHNRCGLPRAPTTRPSCPCPLLALLTTLPRFPDLRSHMQRKYLPVARSDGSTQLHPMIGLMSPHHRRKLHTDHDETLIQPRSYCPVHETSFHLTKQEIKRESRTEYPK